MKKNNGFSFLFFKIISSFKFSYFIEMISVFLIMAVAVLVLSLMNGVQSNHISAIKYAESFPIIVNDIDIQTAVIIKNRIEKNYGVSSYIYVDDTVYASSSSLDSFVLRKAEKAYYEDSIFKNEFELPPFYKNDIIDNTLCLSYYNPYPISSLFVLEKGKSKAVVLKQVEGNSVSFYSGKGIFSPPGMIYAISSFSDGDMNRVNLGIMSPDKTERKILRYLVSEYPEYKLSSFKTERSDIYSALMLEKFFLYFVMLIMSFLILLALYKTMYSIVSSSYDERMLLLAFGKTEKGIFLLYFLSLYMPVFISSLIGASGGLLFTQSVTIAKFLSKYFYTYSLNGLFITDSVQIFSYIITVLIVSFVMLHHILKKNSVINMHEVSLDERDY